VLQLLLLQVEHPSELVADEMLVPLLKLTAEINLLIFVLLHFLQLTGELLPRTRVSNSIPQSKYRNS